MNANPVADERKPEIQQVTARAAVSLIEPGAETYRGRAPCPYIPGTTWRTWWRLFDNFLTLGFTHVVRTDAYLTAIAAIPYGTSAGRGSGDTGRHGVRGYAANDAANGTAPRRHGTVDGAAGGGSKNPARVANGRRPKGWQGPAEGPEPPPAGGSGSPVGEGQKSPNKIAVGTRTKPEPKPKPQWEPHTTGRKPIDGEDKSPQKHE
ncbi:hypothetical protein Q1695_015646 [Nippostrongylus brasiliensis]|nr:hypothetical protein Q1695_015646 [Nippostrongylus brasiliensis]